jgi:hypothetical protein
MPNIVNTLKQSEFWYAQDGMPYRLADMEPSHRHNVLAFLKRRATDLYAHMLWQASDAVEEDLGAMIAITEDPEEWLSRTILVQELERLIRLDGSVDGEFIEPREELTS